MANIPIQGTLAANGNFPIVDGYLTVGSFTTAMRPAASAYPAGTVIRDSDENQLYMTNGTNWSVIGSGGGGSGTAGQVAVFVDSTTVDGYAGFTYTDGSGISIADDIASLGGDIAFTNDSDHTIGVRASTADDVAGYPLAIKGGDAGPAAGLGGAAGGNLTLDAGYSTSGDVGGTIFIGVDNAYDIHLGYSTSPTQVDGYLTVYEDIIFQENGDHYITVTDGSTGLAPAGGSIIMTAGASSQSGDNANGGSIYLNAGVSGGGVGEGGGPYGGSVFLDGASGHINGSVFIGHSLNTDSLYINADIVLHSAGALDTSVNRTIGYSGKSADNYQNAPQLQVVGCRGGFAQTFPGGDAGTGSDLVVLAGPGGLGNNGGGPGTGGLAGPGGNVYVTGGSGGTGGDTAARAVGGNVSINGGSAGFGGAHDGYIYIGDQHIGGLSFFAVAPITQFATTGNTTVTAAGSGTALKADTTSTGGVGSTAYTMADVIKALKLYGLLAQ